MKADLAKRLLICSGANVFQASNIVGKEDLDDEKLVELCEVFTSTESQREKRTKEIFMTFQSQMNHLYSDSTKEQEDG